MKILVTGGAGYLGSVLVEELLERDHEVIVLDNFQHGVPSLAHLCHNHNLTIINRDVRDQQTVTWITRADVLIPLAAIVGADACTQASEWVTKSVNQTSIENLVALADNTQRIIFPCTNSGYGKAGLAECTEEQELAPLSLYGVTKIMAEKAVLSHPRGISLRLATLFGMSPRMRLDLMVNNFVYRAVKDRSLILFEPNFRRNFIHVRDAAKAVCHAVSGHMLPGIYNVGDWRANMTKRELCQRIKKHLPNFTWIESEIGEDPDQRNYVVSNDKLQATGFLLDHSLDSGIEELIRGFTMPFTDRRFSNV